jgi:hypothetical protein
MNHIQSTSRAGVLAALTAIALLGSPGSALAESASQANPAAPNESATQTALPQADAASDQLAGANFVLLAVAGLAALSFISRRRG